MKDKFEGRIMRGDGEKSPDGEVTGRRPGNGFYDGPRLYIRQKADYSFYSRKIVPVRISN